MSKKVKNEQYIKKSELIKKIIYLYSNSAGKSASTALHDLLDIINTAEVNGDILSLQ